MKQHSTCSSSPFRRWEICGGQGLEGDPMQLHFARKELAQLKTVIMVSQRRQGTKLGFQETVQCFLTSDYFWGVYKKYHL